MQRGLQCLPGVLRLGWPIDVGQGPEAPALGAHVRALGPLAGQR